MAGYCSYWEQYSWLSSVLRFGKHQKYQNNMVHIFIIWCIIYIVHVLFWSHIADPFYNNNLYRRRPSHVWTKLDLSKKGWKNHKNMRKNSNLLLSAGHSKIHIFKVRNNALNLCPQLLHSLVTPLLTKQLCSNSGLLYNDLTSVKLKLYSTCPDMANTTLYSSIQFYKG